MTEEHRTCVLDKRRALPTAMLCARHDLGLREDLHDIPTLYALLDDVTEPGSVVMDELTRYQKRPEAPAPVRLEVVTLRDQRTTWDPSNPDALSVLATVGSWSQIVREDLRLSTPDHATVLGEMGVLTTHHDFVIAQAWVDDYLKEMHRVAAALRHTCGEYERSPSVGRCPVMDDDTACGGPLFPDRYGMLRVRCARCGEVWDEAELRRLGLVLES